MTNGTDLTQLGMVPAGNTLGSLDPMDSLPPVSSGSDGATRRTLVSNYFDSGLLAGLQHVAIGVHAWAEGIGPAGEGVDLEQGGDTALWDPGANQCDGLLSVTPFVMPGAVRVPVATVWPRVPGPIPELATIEAVQLTESAAFQGGTRQALKSTPGVALVTVGGETLPKLERGLQQVRATTALTRGRDLFALQANADTLIPLRSPRARLRSYGLSGEGIGSGRALTLPRRDGPIALQFSMQMNEGHRPGDIFFFDILKRVGADRTIVAGTRLVIIAGA